MPVGALANPSMLASLTAVRTPMPDLDPDTARQWAIWLTQQGSVTGSPGEQALPHLLRDRLATRPALRDALTWLIPTTGDASPRACLASLVRGQGRRTVLLTGHFDTVSTEDYGELAPLATEPEALLAALRDKLAAPRNESERRAREDFATGDFLPGRGLLDMKGGLAAGLAALEAFAAAPGAGNLLFVAVPDEELNSEGARALAEALPAIESERGLKVVAAINLDCIGDNGDGAVGRSVALGSVGKLLLTALAVGRQSHASHPFEGVNAGALASALALRLEWAPELADGSSGQPGIAPTLLSLKDGKEGYDVTTPASVFASWNVLSMGRDAADTMAIFRTLAGQALAELGESLARRRGAVSGEPPVPLDIPLLDAAELLAQATASETARHELAELGAKLAAEALPLPEQNRRLTEAAWRLSGRAGPAVVLGFGSLPYPPVRLSGSDGALRLRRAIDDARAQLQAETGEAIGEIAFFPGISDVSFIGEASAQDAAFIARHTPAWTNGVRWSGAVGGVPTVNIGPWGRDYHTPLERIHAPYAFAVLPGFLLAVCRGVLEDESGAG